MDALTYAAPRVEDLRGLWTRSLIAWPDGRRDVTTQVRWLQGPSAYIDLRQPAGMPEFARGGGLDGLRMEDCLALAEQEGFAGDFRFDDGFFEWGRRIDYQPAPLYSDAGSLWWEGDVLIEKGRDIDYIEHWHRELPDDVPVGALALRCLAAGTAARLLRVGPYFMFARDRGVTPAATLHLRDCVAGAADISAARALVDCEISFGLAAGWRIAASTLPYRVGDVLNPEWDKDVLTCGDAGGVMRRWEVLTVEGEASVFSNPGDGR